MTLRGQAGHRAALIEELVSLKAGSGATFANVKAKAKLLRGLPSVRAQLEAFPEDEFHIGVRQALVCAVDKHIAFSRHRLVLQYAFNFTGAGDKLEARRIELEQAHGVSESTIKRDEAIACAELADVLLSLSESPCTTKTRPDPVDPELLRTLVEGLVDNKLSAMLRMGAAQLDPAQAQAVFEGIRATGKLSMGISLIEKLAAAQGRTVTGLDIVTEMLSYIRNYPDARIDRSPIDRIASQDLEWVARYLRMNGFASNSDAAKAAQDSVADSNVGLVDGGGRPTILFPRFVRNTFNLVAFHLIQEESEGWSTLKAAVGTARKEPRQARDVEGVRRIGNDAG